MSQCEQCDTPLTENEVAHVETLPVHRETIELWFCSECTTSGGRP